MPEGSVRSWRDMTPAERRARIVGDALKYEDEDIEYWRNATDAMCGRALYDLLEFTQRVLDSGHVSYPEKPMFPGFPKRRLRDEDPSA